LSARLLVNAPAPTTKVVACQHHTRPHTLATSCPTHKSREPSDTHNNARRRRVKCDVCWCAHERVWVEICLKVVATVCGQGRRHQNIAECEAGQQNSPCRARRALHSASQPTRRPVCKSSRGTHSARWLRTYAAVKRAHATGQPMGQARTPRIEFRLRFSQS
jgi:hypothetical protein